MKYSAPMSGNVWKIMVKEGGTIDQGDVLIILESMKMEIPIEASQVGTVQKILVGEGDFIQEGDPVIDCTD
ncbi:biotin/lipoyl-binding carrier protein [Pontibacillus salicampi]|uniref:Biotin/lipoyl-binding carrier protein n=1 Tax=Pontibacillus salicampi TaxID=1449801 RepID=A0ABV6LR11_9BACI